MKRDRSFFSLFTLADKILIVILMGGSLLGVMLRLFVFPPASVVSAQISVAGKIVKEMRLEPGYHEVYRVAAGEHYNVVESDNGRIRMADADCPDRICVQTGWIHVPPQQIVCLPNQVVIRLTTPGKQDDVDDITR